MATTSKKVLAGKMEGMRAAEIIGSLGGIIVILGIFTPWASVVPESSGSLYGQIYMNGFAALSKAPELSIIYAAGIIGLIFAIWGMFENRRFLPIGGLICGAIALALTMTVSIQLNSFGLNGRYFLADTGYGALLSIIGGVWLIVGGLIGIRGVADKITLFQGKDEKGSLRGGMIGVIGGLILISAMVLPWFSLTLFDPESSASVTGVASGFDEAAASAGIYLALTIGIIGIFLSILGSLVKRQIQVLTIICGAAVALIGSYDIISNVSTFSNRPEVGFGVDVGVIVFIVGAIIMLLGGIVSMREHRAPDQPAPATPSTTS